MAPQGIQIPINLTTEVMGQIQSGNRERRAYGPSRRGWTATPVCVMNTSGQPATPNPLVV
jgi:hypothetical protein